MELISWKISYTLSLQNQKKKLKKFMKNWSGYSDSLYTRQTEFLFNHKFKYFKMHWNARISLFIINEYIR